MLTICSLYIYISTLLLYLYLSSNLSNFLYIKPL